MPVPRTSTTAGAIPRGAEVASSPPVVTFRGHPGVTRGRQRNPDLNVRRTAMRFEWMAQRAVGAAVLVWAGLAILAGPATAQLSGDLRYTRGYDLVPNPPVAGQPTTFVLYGVYPTGCGVVVEKSGDPVAIRLESFASCPDSVTT